MTEYAKKQTERERLLAEIEDTKKRLDKIATIACQERIDLGHKLRVLRRQRDEVMV